MKAFFDLVTRLSMRFRWLTLALVVLVMVVGTVAGLELQQELLPPIEFPQTFILANAGGMTGEQVLTVVTARLEAELATIPEIVDISSTTNGAFGAFIVAANDFGLNQEKLRQRIQTALDKVWFPQRAILPADGQDGREFAQSLLNDFTPEMLLYFAKANPTFLFQLSPELWAALPDDTVQAGMAYLAQQVSESTSAKSALQSLIEQEFVPQLNALDIVASVQISGGQTLPEEGATQVAAAPVEGEQRSLLLQLSPKVWTVVKARLAGVDALDESAIEVLKAVEITVPDAAPALPESWQTEYFHDVTDLQEMGSLAASVATVLNDFLETGEIAGALGRTDDLTPDTLAQMLAIEPSLVEYFEADHLVAMSPEVFAALPAEFIAGLDSFTRDELAAKALAESITGEVADIPPARLPAAWRISPPQLLSFSFADIPLATFSVYSTSEGAAQVADAGTGAETNSEGGAGGGGLTGLLTAIGGIFAGGNADNELALGDAWSVLANRLQFANQSLETADDILTLGNGQASSVLNIMNASVPAQFTGYEIRLLDNLTPAIVAYFAEREPDFYANLDAAVLLKFSPEVLQALPDDVLSTLDAETAAQVQAIANGDSPSAAAALGDAGGSVTIPADPTAPALNSQWQTIAQFVPGVKELNNAYDLFRFPNAIGTPGQFINGLFESPQGANFAPNLLGNMSVEAFAYIAEQDPNFINELTPQALVLFSQDVFNTLPEDAQKRAKEGERFRPTTTVTRTNGNPSLLVTVFKNGDANTVEAFYQVKELMDELDARDEAIGVSIAFEQSSFIEESIAGVIKEGTLGALFAIIVILIFLSGGVWRRTGRNMTGIVLIVIFTIAFAIVIFGNLAANNGDFGAAFYNADVLLRALTLMGIGAGLFILLFPGQLPYPSWRSTLVIGVSIPLSVFAALAMMHWIPPVVNNALAGSAESSSFLTFMLRLFPQSITLNIMTLSGLTVAIGRVVDDSIVVLENIFKQIETGMDKREAILSGTRDVSVAIFAATGVTVIVFLPLGLTGGLIGEFFLPFGLAVTYALLASFVVAITVVPVLAELFIPAHDVPEEGVSWMQRLYTPALNWVLKNNGTRWVMIVLAFVSFAIGGALFAGRPFAFIPALGEPQLGIAVSMPAGTTILETNALVEQLEEYLEATIPEDELITIRSIVGGGGLGIEALVGGGGGVSENAADITVGIESQEVLEELTPEIRAKAEEIFGVDNAVVSAATISSQGFGGFEVVLAGPDQEVLEALDAQIIAALSEVEGLTNVSSNLTLASAGGDAVTYIRTNQSPAVEYTAEIESDDTIGVTSRALESVRAKIELPEGVTLGQGFNSQLQSEGFSGVFVAMGIAILIVIVILVVLFGSPIYWLAIILSILVAPVGAAVALTVTDRVLGISALIGLLMLLGLVVTNAVVLIDRVGANRYERKMPLRESLMEGGNRRVRPILMTALATIIALIPLAMGLSKGAIIASELGTVVIGGIISSTLLTLLVTPAAYYLLTPLHEGIAGLFGRRTTANTQNTPDKRK